MNVTTVINNRPNSADTASQKLLVRGLVVGIFLLFWKKLEYQMTNRSPTGDEFDAQDAGDEALKNDMAERLRRAVDLAGGPGLVSERSGVALRTLGNYTGGRTELKAGALIKLADACGVSLDWLATGQGHALAGEAVNRSAVDERQKAIMAMLNDETMPMAAERLQQRPDLVEIRRELEDMAHRQGLSESQRGFADLLLRLAFDDVSAAQRSRLREERLHAQLRASGAAFQKAVDVVGWQPPAAFGQALRTLIFSYGISLEDAISVLDALKYDMK